MRRIKMLEFALRQERIRYARAANGIEGKFDILKDHPDLIEDEKLPERPPYQKPRGHQSILLKFLEEIGFEEVFNSTDVAGIKDLFNKAASSLSKNQELIESISKIEADVKAKSKDFNLDYNVDGSQSDSKGFSNKDKLNELLKQVSKPKDKSLKEELEEQQEEDAIKDQFNSSFDSVKRDDEEITIKAQYSEKLSEIILKHEFNVHLDSVRGVQFIKSLD